MYLRSLLGPAFALVAGFRVARALFAAGGGFGMNI